MREEYSDGPGGLSGNDDAGQMSAWYIFAAMGFYPLNPVSGEYQLCSPLFDRVVIKLPGNKKLEIVCNKKMNSNAFINRIKWNGKIHNKNFISYSDIMKGGKLEMDLVDSPVKGGASFNGR